MNNGKMMKDNNDERLWNSCKKEVTFNNWFKNQSKRQQNKLIFSMDREDFTKQARQEMRNVCSKIRRWIKHGRKPVCTKTDSSSLTGMETVKDSNKNKSIGALSVKPPKKPMK